MSEAHSYGDAFSTLTSLQQRFVELLVCAPMRSAPKTLKTAGFQGSYEACKKSSQRLMRSKVIHQAIQEVAAVRLTALVPKAVNALHDVLSDRSHRDYAKDALAVLDRAGHHAVQEFKQTIT